MRLGTTFRCPQCRQLQPAIDVICERCQVAVVDEHGQTAIVLASKVVTPTYHATPLGKMAARALIPAFGVAGFGALAPALLILSVPAGVLLWVALFLLQIVLDRGRLGADRVAMEAQRAMARAKLSALREEHALCPIAKLPSDEVRRVRGRVEPQTTVRPGVVAELYESSWRRLGSFLVVDESGEALVDDDAVELWNATATGDPITIRPGALVEVVGRGRYHRIGQQAEGYRGARELTRFVFEGDRDCPVHVIKLE